MNKKAKGIIVAMVEQLKGAIATINDERCFLVMVKLKDLQ
jgi:hypothetical protein